MKILMKPLFFAITSLFLSTALFAEQQSMGYLGIAIDTVPPSIKAHYPDEVSNTQGMIITQLADISPAADDGIKLYDILIAYDGKPVTQPDKLMATISSDTAGRIAQLKVIRQGKVMTIPVTMGKKQWSPAAQRQAMVPQSRPQQSATAKPQNTIRSTPAPNRQAQPQPLNIAGKPMFPMQKKREKQAWGDERHIWSDFYTDSTNDMWDNMINVPFKMGRMPGGWRAPSMSMPDPVTIGDAVTNQMPPILEEMGNMTDFTD